MAAMIVRARIYDGAPRLQYPFNRPSTPVRGPFTRRQIAIQESRRRWRRPYRRSIGARQPAHREPDHIVRPFAPAFDRRPVSLFGPVFAPLARFIAAPAGAAVQTFHARNRHAANRGRDPAVFSARMTAILSPLTQPPRKPMPGQAAVRRGTVIRGRRAMPATRPRRSTDAPPMASSFGGDAVNFIRCLSSCRSADNRRGVRRGQRCDR